MPDELGEIARERIVRNGLEHTEWQFAKYVSERGVEPAVFIFNLLDEFGRMFAEGHIGKDEVGRQVEQYDSDHVTPVFYLSCGLENASKLIGTGEFEMSGDLPGIPVPPGMFLVVGVSHSGMLLRWLPKPE
jgi:hypothetical protein